MKKASVGVKLKVARLEKKLTQEEAAKIFNVTRQAISSWEVERNYPDLKTLVLLSDFYEISLDVLLREDMEMVNQISKEIKLSKKRKYINIILLILLIVSFGSMFYMGKKKLDLNTSSFVPLTNIRNEKIELNGDSLNKKSCLTGQTTGNNYSIAYISEYESKNKTLYIALLEISNKKSNENIYDFKYELQDDAKKDINQIIFISDTNTTKKLKNAKEQQIIYTKNSTQ